MSSEPLPPPFRLLYVCLGNICRSPMAMVITRRIAADRGLTGLVVDSAGLLEAGRPASFEAEQVAAERGLSLVNHLSSFAAPTRVANYDLVLTMEAGQIPPLAAHAKQVDLITRYVGDPGGDVPDPYGQQIPVYRVLADRLEKLGNAVLDRLVEEGKLRKQPPWKPGV